MQYPQSRYPLQRRTDLPWIWDTGSDNGICATGETLESVSIQVSGLMQPATCVWAQSPNMFDRIVLTIPTVQSILPTAPATPPQILIDIRTGTDFLTVKGASIGYTPDRWGAPLNTGWICQLSGLLATQVEIWARVAPADPNATPVKLTMRLLLDYIGCCDVHTTLGEGVVSIQP